MFSHHILGRWLSLSNGDGTFAAAVGVPACRSFSIIGDFNGDRKADLICRTVLLLGKGDGTFQTPIPLTVAATDSPLLAADFNHDGNLDFLVSHSGGGYSVELGHGDGTFASPIAVLPGSKYEFTFAADFNGDGFPDVAGNCGTSGLICVALGKGDGTFGSFFTATQFSSGHPQAVADFKKDGKLDLVADDGSVLAGNGDGTFAFPVLTPGTTALVADFNGDGQPDIAQAVLNLNSGVISVLLNDSPGEGLLTAGISSASWTPSVATGGITSAFGTNLASGDATASVLNDSLPTTLGGIRVHIRDSSGDTLAPLIYVSPNQINYVMTSSDTFAFIGIERVGTPYVPKAIGLKPLAESVGLYNLNGFAAATAVSVAPNGTQTPVPVGISCSNTSCSPTPINVSGNPVYLSLYGTGFDTIPMGVQCFSGSQPLTVTYAGPQKLTPGLDQINLLLPASLAGAGTVSITCYDQASPTTLAAMGTPSNAVKIAIQ